MEDMFQTPSAGRWVLQLSAATPTVVKSPAVSNPISGEVGAAASRLATTLRTLSTFQTPSAGRWVLQLLLRLAIANLNVKVSNPISGEVGAAAQGHDEP